MEDTKEIVKVNTGESATFDEKVTEILFYGNLAKLTEAERNAYLMKYCKELGLNPFARPFDIIPLNGKLTVYANKGCAAQLQDARGISVDLEYEGPFQVGQKVNEDVYVVKVKTSDKAGRTGYNVGSVPIKGLQGEALSNAVMKCHTKAIRRAVLNHAGLGFPDESELDSIPGFAQYPVREAPRMITPGPQIQTQPIDVAPPFKMGEVKK